MELVMAIALWCGDSSYHRKTDFEVQQCRDAIITCVNLVKPTDPQQFNHCFVQQKRK